MTASEIAAWWGATIATLVLAWDIYKWRKAGPNLWLRVMTDMEPYNLPQFAGKTPVAAVVSNKGDRPTTITILGFSYYDAWWKAILRKKASHVGWVGNPSPTQPVPFELKPGAEWTGMIEQTAEIEAWSRDGWLYATVYHSHAKRPIRGRIVRAKPRAPVVNLPVEL